MLMKDTLAAQGCLSSLSRCFHSSPSLTLFSAFYTVSEFLSQPCFFHFLFLPSDLFLIYLFQFFFVLFVSHSIHSVLCCVLDLAHSAIHPPLLYSLRSFVVSLFVNFDLGYN